MNRVILLFVPVLLITLAISCIDAPKKQLETVPQNQMLDKQMLHTVMQKHLDAISNRDLETLESTLSPEGNMQLILPGTEIIEKTGGFMEYHREWFKADDWTLESRILNSEVGETLAMVVVESIYREPERDGKPYFNRMSVSYTFKKIEGKWYVIKDHMASVQKSTDSK